MLVVFNVLFWYECENIGYQWFFYWFFRSIAK